MATAKKSGFFKRLLAYFFQGTLLVVPLAVTIYVIYKLFILIDGIIPRFLPWEIPGLGIVILLVTLTLVGLIGSTIIAQPIMRYFQRLLDKAPLIKTVYSAIKDLLSAFVGKKKSFTKPVLVRINKDNQLEKLGFVTKEDLADLGIGKEKIAVYLPHSYAWSGNLFIVPADHVTPLEAHASDVMKFIVSGGVTQFDHEDNPDEHKDETNPPYQLNA